jgi:hypothetical protein
MTRFGVAQDSATSGLATRTYSAFFENALFLASWAATSIARASPCTRKPLRSRFSRVAHSVVYYKGPITHLVLGKYMIEEVLEVWAAGVLFTRAL